ncbi:MAG: hypothetical protein V1673_01000 [Candidatus Omnitrophota bacterium]
MKNLKTRAHEKGFVLLAVYMAAIFICLFSAVLFARHQVAVQATERYQNRVLAFNAAEAGIDRALWELTTDFASRRTNTATTDYTSSSATSLGQHEFLYTISLAGTPTGLTTYRKIRADGYAPSYYTDTTDTVAGYPTGISRPRASQHSTIIVYAEVVADPPTLTGSLFNYGIYTTGSINLSGSTFDSYNSSLGAYGGANVSSNGSIAADTTLSEGIELNSTTVKGTVLVGEGGNPSTVIEQEHSTIIPPVTDPVTPPTGNLPAGWALGAPTPIVELVPAPTEVNLSSVTGTTTLAGNPDGTTPTYYHASQISVSGSKGAIVTTGGPVMIYVDGGVEITGIGTTVPNNKPGNLQIYVTGTASCKVQGNGSFYGGLYAPNSDVTFKASDSGKGGTWFGAVVAKTFSTGGGGTSAFHFDTAMVTGTVSTPSSTPPRVGITTWQEMNTLAWDTGQAAS